MYEVVDVSAWRDRELTVTQEADALRRAQALGRMGTWEWSIREDRVTWSDTLLEMFGFAPGTAFDFEMYAQLVHPDDLPMIEETLDAALKTGSVFTYTHRMMRADRPGRPERVFECFGEVVCAEDGTPLRALGTAHDVTQSSRVHDELVRMAEQDPLTGLLEPARAHPGTGTRAGERRCGRAAAAGPGQLQGRQRPARPRGRRPGDVDAASVRRCTPRLE